MNVQFDPVWQLDLPARKQLAARLLWLVRKAAVDDNLAAPNPRHENRMKSVDYAIGGVETDDHRSLEEYVNDLTDIVFGHEASLNKANKDTAARAFDGSPFSGVAHFMCSKCGSRKELICDGFLRDRKLFRDPKGGNCLRFLKEMIESFTRIAEHAYRIQAESDLQRPLVPPLIVETRRGTGSAGTLPIDGEFEPHATNNSATLRIYWPINDGLDRAILSLPYLIFHEVFVHGAQGAARDDRRFTVKDRCSFTEGGVDGVACEILLNDVLVDEDSLPPLLRGLRDEFSDYCRSYYQERRRYQPSDSDNDLAQRADRIRHARSMGYRKIFEFLRRVARASNRKNEWAYQVILLLNLHLDAESRVDFFKLLDKLGKHPKIEMPLADLLQRFIDDRDPMALLARLKQLHTGKKVLAHVN